MALISSRLSDKLTLLTRADIGYADEYGDDPYPFFKNYYVGGANSVRGYKQSSIGKKFWDTAVKDWVSFGGTTKLVSKLGGTVSGPRP